MCVAPSTQWHVHDVCSTCGVMICNIKSGLAPHGAPAWYESVRWVWIWTNVSRFNPTPIRRQWCFLYQLSHHQCKWVANNWFNQVFWSWALNVLDGLDYNHFRWDSLWEFLQLFLDVFLEGRAGPSSDQHDWKDWDTGQIHGHCYPGSNWMCFNFVYWRMISLVLPMATMPSWMRSAIIFEVMLISLFLWRARGTGESLVIPFKERILETIDYQSLTGHKMGSDLCFWVTTSDFLLFFCLSKVIELQSAKCNLAMWGVILPFWMKTIFQRQSCLLCFCLALGSFEYLHKRTAQKLAAAASLSITCLRSVDLEERIRWRTQKGKAFCCVSFGSSFFVPP